MITEQELKERCTPDIIMKMCQLAEGFEYYKDKLYKIKFECIFLESDDEELLTSSFPLLIYRAVEGWNKNHLELHQIVHITNYRFNITFHNRNEDSVYSYCNYQSQTLTAAECALLHCLLDIFEKEHRDGN